MRQAKEGSQAKAGKQADMIKLVCERVHSDTK